MKLPKIPDIYEDLPPPGSLAFLVTVFIGMIIGLMVYWLHGW